MKGVKEMTKDAYVWLRIGDQGDYEKFDSPEEAAQELGQYTSDREIKFTSLGVCVGPFQGDNYVSLFWGDDDAQPVGDAELSDLEKEAFQNTLVAA